MPNRPCCHRCPYRNNYYDCCSRCPHQDQSETRSSLSRGLEFLGRSMRPMYSIETTFVIPSPPQPRRSQSSRRGSHSHSHSHKHESDEDYCLRKDRLYEMLLDMLKEAKQERDKIRELRRHTRDLSAYEKWEREYKKACEEVNALEKKVADQKREVLSTRR